MSIAHVSALLVSGRLFRRWDETVREVAVRRLAGRCSARSRFAGAVKGPCTTNSTPLLRPARSLLRGLAPSRSGGYDARSGTRRFRLEVLPSLGRCGACRALGRVVVVQLALRPTGRPGKDVNVRIRHGEVSPDVGGGSATATATGTTSESS